MVVQRDSFCDRSTPGHTLRYVDITVDKHPSVNRSEMTSVRITGLTTKKPKEHEKRKRIFKKVDGRMEPQFKRHRKNGPKQHDFNLPEIVVCFLLCSVPIK